MPSEPGQKDGHKAAKHGSQEPSQPTGKPLCPCDVCPGEQSECPGDLNYAVVFRENVLLREVCEDGTTTNYHGWRIPQWVGPFRCHHDGQLLEELDHGSPGNGIIDSFAPLDEAIGKPTVNTGAPADLEEEEKQVEGHRLKRAPMCRRVGVFVSGAVEDFVWAALYVVYQFGLPFLLGVVIALLILNAK